MVNNKKGVAIVGFGGMGGWHKNKLLKSDVAELCGILLSCDFLLVAKTVLCHIILTGAPK